MEDPHHLGKILEITLIKALSVSPRLSVIPRGLPPYQLADLENGWHGGPATNSPR